MSSARTRQAFGSALMIAVLIGLVVLLTRPRVAEPMGRVAAVLASGLRGEDDADPTFAVPTTEHVGIGDPVYVIEPSGDARPVAHVIAVRDEPAPALVLRFEPGEETLAAGASRALELTLLPATKRLGGAYETAVPPEVARHLQAVLMARARQLWTSAIRPELERRLPAFLARVDPSQDPRSRALLSEVGRSVMDELDPMLDDLGDEIASSLEDRLDFLDRMGLLWKFVRGDAEGIKGEVMPIAANRAQLWFDEHQDELVAALTRGIEAKGPELREWFTGQVLEAAREELVDPLWDSQQDRLEQEGEAVLRLLSREVVLAPGGGFRLRFSQVLRATLLGKRTPLLILAPRPDAKGDPVDDE